MKELNRYSRIESKNKREIVLLQGNGCRYKKCCFCDYYLDVSQDQDKINAQALSEVSGMYGILEVINSGSFGELNSKTLEMIYKVAQEKNIKQLIFECHYLYRNEIAPLKEFFSAFEVRIKLGLESFNMDLRERVMKKGIKESDPQKIAKGFDEANFLIGIAGQNLEMIEQDLKLGLKYFDRICVNIMCSNSKAQANQEIIESFIQTLYPVYRDNERIDFLLSNTDFGVG